MKDTPIVEMRGIHKQFGRIQANADVDFTLRRGEIHAIVGENGAGKSTLMKILYGLYRPDAGEIFVDGRAVAISSPRRAMRLGLGDGAAAISRLSRFSRHSKTSSLPKSLVNSVCYLMSSKQKKK